MKEFGLPKSERITHKKTFEQIYSAGKVVFSRGRRVKALYLTAGNNNGQHEVLAAFAAGRKAGNAVWRNRVKRLLREAYRTNKRSLFNTAEQNNISVYIVFSPGYLNSKKNKYPALRDIESDVIDILKKITGNL